MNPDVIEDLKKAVIQYDIENAEHLATKAISLGADPLDCAKALTDGIREVGDEYGTGNLFLPDLVCASEVMKIALPVITAALQKQGKEFLSLGKIVIGTVFGDIHDIGKSIVATLLYASGFQVIDLGTNVHSQDFSKAVKEHQPDILAMSSLLTTTMLEQKTVIDRLTEANLRHTVKIIVGGAPVNQEFAHRIGADGYGATAPEGVRVAKRLLSLK
jgi:corrinoid protein of di/trimethylamine methyltransferase